MATFTVNSILDNTTADGFTTLREAIEAANATPEADSIVFDPTVFTGVQTITLTLGQLRVTEDLTITGTGQSNLIIDADGNI